jgi:hypothetical protein
MNVILEVTPSSGQRMVMQTGPGWIASMTDFWVTGAGLVVAETTIVGYSGYDVTKVPEYVRARLACQYGQDIDSWVRLLDAGNNGGYANMWLVGDIRSNEIARYEQGLRYQSFVRKSDGWYFGDNAPEDPATTTSASRPARGARAGRRCSRCMPAASTSFRGRRSSPTLTTST